MNEMVKYANMQEVKSVDEENRIIEFIASKEIPDYDDDMVKIDGLDIAKIKKNKSFLWSHKQSDLPIGKIVKVWKEGNLLKGKAQMTSEEEYAFGYSVYKLIKGGYINNISISFMPDYKEVEYKENKKTGERTRIFNKSTLLEVSAVNIGCNTGTSIQVKSFKDSINKAWDDDVIDGTELNQLEEAIDKDIEETVESVDYDAEIKILKEEMDKLKDKNYMYKLFDEYNEKSFADDVMEEIRAEGNDVVKEFFDESASIDEEVYKNILKELDNK